MIKLYLYKKAFNINGKDINDIKNKKVIKRLKLNKFSISLAKIRKKYF